MGRLLCLVLDNSSNFNLLYQFFAPVNNWHQQLWRRPGDKVGRLVLGSMREGPPSDDTCRLDESSEIVSFPEPTCWTEHRGTS